jgi:hypothetical protein
LDIFLADEINAERFSQEFGRTYVMDIADTDLSATEHQTFKDVFAVTKLYANPAQRAIDTYPGRKNEKDVRVAVERAKRALRRELS